MRLKKENTTVVINDHGIMFYVPIDTPQEIRQHLEKHDFIVLFNHVEGYYWIFTEPTNNYWIDFFNVDSKADQFEISYFERSF